MPYSFNFFRQTKIFVLHSNDHFIKSSFVITFFDFPHTDSLLCMLLLILLWQQQNVIWGGVHSLIFPSRKNIKWWTKWNKTYSFESLAHNAFKWGYLACFVLSWRLSMWVLIIITVNMFILNSKKNTPQTIKYIRNAYSTSFNKKKITICALYTMFIFTFLKK